MALSVTAYASIVEKIHRRGPCGHLEAVEFGEEHHRSQEALATVAGLT